MLDIEAELSTLAAALDEACIPYAVAGAIALAVHGHPRATPNIDFLVLNDSLDRAKAVARACGFTIEALPLRTSRADITIQRLSKLSGRFLLTLNLLVATEPLEGVWSSRVELPWRDRRLWCVSRPALVSMKLAAGRPQDLADIARLEESS